MSNAPKGDIPMVVHGTEPGSQTTQTPGMERKPAIHKSSVGASKIWFGKNGTWGNSSNPATGSNGIDFSGDTSFTSNKPYFPACSVDQCECAYNFGNGYFGTTAITTNSGNGYSDSDGKAKFNYEVPTNFKAITTRGLNL